MRSVRIPENSARVALRALEGLGGFINTDAADAIRDALKPQRSVKLSRSRKETKRATKNEETESIYRSVNARADGMCECGCGNVFMDGHPDWRREMDHAFSRGKEKQNERNCWMLTARCHRLKHRGAPSASMWWGQFRDHCERHEYVTEMRLAERKRIYAQAKEKFRAGAALSRGVANV